MTNSLSSTIWQLISLGTQLSPIEVMKQFVKEQGLETDATNCSVDGACQNAITGLINRQDSVGGLSLHVDSNMLRITQHPEAGDFEIEIPCICK